MQTRRELLASTVAALAAPLAALRAEARSLPSLRLTSIELLPVRATSRTVWLFVRLKASTGLIGHGEASDAFGFANTTADDAAQMRRQLQALFELVKGRSPLDVAGFRDRGLPIARGGLVAATAFSAIEQAMWDLSGQALGVPVYALLGGKVRDRLPVYANINRATNPRTPEGFAAAARRAFADGFRAVKAAPFDGFPPSGSPQSVIDAAVDQGIAAMTAIRDAVGPNVDVMVDCHSFFDVDLAARVAKRLEPLRLRWYEEPVPPERIDDTLAIKQRITQPMAAGEVLFGIAGFEPLVRTHAVGVIMPDVKHCGGVLELTRIAAFAAAASVNVAPHNPSGPVSTMASLHACIGLPNANLLELQYGEVPWRGEVLLPAERFVDGQIGPSDRPGFGIALNERAIKQHALPL